MTRSTHLPAVGTVITADYLPFAKALAESLRRHAPPHTFHALVVGAPVEPPVAGPDVHLLTPADLNHDAVALLRNRYSDKQDEFRWSLKPILLQHLLQTAESALWVDPDLFFVGDCAFLFEQLAQCSVLLSPHWRSMDPAADPRGFQLMFLDGTFNAGLVGATRVGLPALQWWEKACQYRCTRDVPNGWFLDQRYLDALHAQFEGVDVIRHRGCNLAAWNRVDCRRTAGPDGTTLINGREPAVFIHFTRRTLDGILSGHDPLLAPHLATYQQALQRHGWRQPLDIPASSSSPPAPARQPASSHPPHRMWFPRINPQTAPIMLERVNRLTDESTPRWGKFAPGAMLNHLRRALAASLGVTKFDDMSTWYLRNIMQPRVMWGLKRIPRAKIELPPHFLDLRARKVEGERGRFLMQLDDFLKACEQDPARREMHPYFGPMTLRDWERWHWLHFHHHFTQFGI